MIVSWFTSNEACLVCNIQLLLHSLLIDFGTRRSTGPSQRKRLRMSIQFRGFINGFDCSSG
ncbi:hypothetical protein BDW74DRAFT_146603 [Aspergillus multicolor]|uniref:uncharacterized protein n=1 Tax=Aspergillus multicolor TaxID=41759 RepID=UPI003CCDCDEB